jgi:hypothetical protein
MVFDEDGDALRPVVECLGVRVILARDSEEARTRLAPPFSASGALRSW